MGEGPESPGGDDRGHLPQLLIIGLVASAAGIAAALAIDWWPTLASEEGRKIDTLWDVLLVVSVPIFVLVITVVLYSVWRFRLRPGQEHLDGPPLHGNTRLEIVWTTVPAIILVALCTYAYLVLDDIEDAKGQTPVDVRVVGQQFTWTFFYKNPQAGGREISSARLYLPANTPILFHVQTRDVIHDFWVPAFRLKIDAVPGVTTNFKATTTGRAGTYPVVCAELCGLGHAVMRQSATVMPQDRYRAWIDQQAKGGGGPAGMGGAAGAGTQTSAPDGKQIFTTAGCAGCHTLPDAEATGTAGPDLGQALKGSDEAFIKESIVRPNAEIAKGYGPDIMPQDYESTLKPQEVDALVTYLKKVAG